MRHPPPPPPCSKGRTDANNLPGAFAVVMLGGALQILFGFLRVGRHIADTPCSVVSGFDDRLAATRAAVALADDVPAAGDSA